jgi:DNA-binding NtrC family response regulator
MLFRQVIRHEPWPPLFPDRPRKNDDVLDVVEIGASNRCRKIEIGPHRRRRDAVPANVLWPGNIRQLENVIERAVVIAEGRAISVAELPAEVFQFADDESPLATNLDAESTVTRPLSPLRRERLRMEREELVRAMGAARGNKAETARALGIAQHAGEPAEKVWIGMIESPTR